MHRAIFGRIVRTFMRGFCVPTELLVHVTRLLVIVKSSVDELNWRKRILPRLVCLATWPRRMFGVIELGRAMLLAENVFSFDLAADMRSSTRY